MREGRGCACVCVCVRECWGGIAVGMEMDVCAGVWCCVMNQRWEDGDEYRC